MNEPSELNVPVEGGTLRVLRFGGGPHAVLAVHGITASGMAFRAVARHLPPTWSLYALDLRGRGGSTDAPGPYGIDRHAADVCRAAELLSGGAADSTHRPFPGRVHRAAGDFPQTRALRPPPARRRRTAGPCTR